MDASFSEPISQVLQVPPLRREAGDVCPADRPRLFWTNLVTTAPDARQVDAAACLEEGWRPGWELTGASCRPRFRTFLRPFGPGAPPEFPVRWRRFPLSLYDERGLVFLKEAPPQELDKARGLLAAARAARDTRPASGTVSSTHPRAVLASWIHTEGGDCTLRPLWPDERDRALGFPAGASGALGLDWSHEEAWAAASATGNSFSHLWCATSCPPGCAR
jgi:hypothetical protein